MIMYIPTTSCNKMGTYIAKKIQDTRNDLSDVALRINHLKATLTSRYNQQKMLRNNIWRLEKRENILLSRQMHSNDVRERNELREVRKELDEDKYSYQINKQLIKEWEGEIKDLSKRFKSLQIILSLDLIKYKKG